MKPTLVILAAGMASRFGRLKQIEGLGPSGETIIDYSIHDAIEAGFGKIVMIIRAQTHAYFSSTFTQKYGHKIQFEFVDQELDFIPSSFTPHPDRTKPWGTGHALLMAKPVVQEPFLVINGDDFYGRESFVRMADYLSKLPLDTPNFCMVGYPLSKTLSEYGTVSRGVCDVNENGCLNTVTERTAIQRVDGRMVYQDADGAHVLAEDTKVSMNFWGFSPYFLDVLENDFISFLQSNSQELTKEFFIPSVVSHLLEKGAKCDVLPCNSEWFGVTYKEDVSSAKERLVSLTKAGVYSSPLA